MALPKIELYDDDHSLFCAKVRLGLAHHVHAAISMLAHHATFNLGPQPSSSRSRSAMQRTVKHNTLLQAPDAHAYADATVAWVPIA